MGEKIRDLASFKIGNVSFVIEENAGWEKEKIDIHIQSNNLRYCCSSEDFMDLLSAVVCAKRKFDSLKNTGYKEEQKDV